MTFISLQLIGFATEMKYSFVVQLGGFVANTGLARWIGFGESDASKFGTFTEEEKEIYQAVQNRRSSTKNMVNEVQSIQENARLVDQNKNPNTPMLLFWSNGEGSGFEKNEWSNFMKEFASREDNRAVIELDASHYIHNIEYERIAEEAIKFIEEL